MLKTVAFYQDTALSAAVPLRTLTGPIADASNATPIVITDVAHGLVTGNHVIIAGVAGNTAANGAWKITKLTNDSFSLDGSVGNGAYTSGGNWHKTVASALALIQAETQSVRWRDDGTDPTAAIGHILAAGSSFLYSGSLRNFRVIEVAASAKLNVTFYNQS